MNNFKEDDGTIVRRAEELQFLREEKAATLHRLNKLDKLSPNFKHDQYTYENEIARLIDLIQNIENEFISRLGNGRHKFQLNFEGNVEPTRAEINIEHSTVKLNIYSWLS